MQLFDFIKSSSLRNREVHFRMIVKTSRAWLPEKGFFGERPGKDGKRDVVIAAL